MSTFVEVNIVSDFPRPAIINLDNVDEIAPLRSGGCNILFGNGAPGAGRTAITVSDDYSKFQQFALQMVTPDMVSGKIKALKKD